MRKQFRNLISLHKARSIIDRFDKPSTSEEVALNEARGRIAARHVKAKVDVPPFAKSLMDGFAVRASNTYGADEQNPCKLIVSGESLIGTVPQGRVKPNKAFEVATGAVIPQGANAVVKVEQTERDGDSLFVEKAVAPGENILQVGSDVELGQILIKKGKTLSAVDIALLAATGRGSVPVFRKPKVGIISTGPELVPAGEILEPGQIYEINSNFLGSAVRDWGGEPVHFGIVHDDEEILHLILSQAINDCDVVISTGSTSAGPEDIAYRVVEEAGVLHAHGIKIKPGKPTIIAEIDDKPFFGLPGNPSSAVVVFNHLVGPYIGKLSRKTDRSSPTINATLIEDVISEGGRTEYKYVGLVKRNEKLGAYPINKASGTVSLLSQADGYLKIPQDQLLVEQGEKTSVHLLSKEFTAPDLLIMGSNCVGLSELVPLLPLHTRIVNRGSQGGIRAVAKGIADMAGIHVWTPRGYNIPFIKDRDLQGVSLISGYYREQGLVVPQGNPDDIHSVKDLIGGQIRIVNRNAGSGTRLLFDFLLHSSIQNQNTDPSKIQKSLPGYSVEVTTHGGVAAAVKSGKAGAGLAIRPVAREYELDFIPLQTESFDFLVRNDLIESTLGKQIQSSLRSQEFSEKIAKLPGLEPSEDIGEIKYSC